MSTQTTKKESKKLHSGSPKCGWCSSTNVYGMSRIVGYFSPIENWNKSKQAELCDRQKGDYSITKAKI